MPKFKSRPIEIHAMQWTGSNTKELKQWMRELLIQVTVPEEVKEMYAGIGVFLTKSETSSGIWSYTANGQDWSDDIAGAVYDFMHETYVGVVKGNWIIFGMKYEFYPCDDEVFRAKYEGVEDV